MQKVQRGAAAGYSYVDYRSHCQSQLSNVRDVSETDRQADNARQLRDGLPEVKSEFYFGL